MLNSLVLYGVHRGKAAERSVAGRCFEGGTQDVQSSDVQSTVIGHAHRFLIANVSF